MKEALRGNRCGFSTLELMLALALISLAFGGTAMALYGANYWSAGATAHLTAIGEVETELAAWRRLVQTDFLAASSSKISDISPCVKQIAAGAAWRLNPFPTTTVQLLSAVSSPVEAQALGGDCPLHRPAGNWSRPRLSASTPLAGAPLAIDVLSQTSYMGINQSPHLKIVRDATDLNFNNHFQLTEAINDLDAIRHGATGRVYLYAATASTTAQLQIIETTDPHNPRLAATRSLFGVDPSGGAPEGWRLFYYDHHLYITTRLTAGPEFHIFEVSDPDRPFEISVGYNLSTSVYDLAVRAETIGGETRRLAYLATTHDAKEIQILDVTDPTEIRPVTTFNLPDHPACSSNQPDAKTLFLLGKILYVGRENLTGCPALADLYLLDLTDILNQLTIKISADLGASVIGLKASGSDIFVATTNLTGPAASKLLDQDEQYLYLAKDKARKVAIWRRNDGELTLVGDLTAASDAWQLIKADD